ncbi:MAG TPA: response regulator [Myxococcota bacterium]|nr:response regulator [Myxococcota bacterium]
MSRTNLLHVEDDASAAYALARTLEDEDVDITHAFNADQARRALRAGGFGLMIVDVMLPPRVDREGLDLCLELRRTHPGLPLLIFTNRQDDGLLDEIKAHGIAWLDKGADDEALLARVRELLGGGP